MERDKQKAGESKKGQDSDPSRLFLVRLWTGNASGVGRAGGEKENRGEGKVQHVLSGEAASFSDWSTLVDLLTGMMPPATLDGGNGGSSERP